MDVCWYYFTNSPGYTYNSGTTKCTNEGAKLMVLENFAKFQYMTTEYMNNIFPIVINFDIWVLRSWFLKATIELFLLKNILSNSGQFINNSTPIIQMA